MNKKINFDIEEKKIIGNRKNIEYLIRVSQNILKKNFSLSFIEWLKKYGEEVYINKGSGNFNTNKLLPKNKREEIISVTYGSKVMKKNGWPINEDFIPFGSDGGENIFVFYTKFSRNGEYPVIMISLDDERYPYVFMGSSFENFVNTYVKLEILRPNFDEKELLNIAKNAIKTYEPLMGMDFANQLVNWEWEFKSLNQIDLILSKYGFKKDHSNKKLTI